MDTVILVGLQGSGKSTLLQEIIRQIPHLSVVNYGDKMLEEAQLQGIPRDALRKMDTDYQQKIGIQAAKKIIQSKDKTVLVDTHALVRTPMGFIPGLPRQVLEILSPKALAWIECDPSLIIQRRKEDKGRNRDLETEKELNLHQELTRSYLAACSMWTGALLYPIDNNSTSIEHNAQPLIRLLEGLK